MSEPTCKTCKFCQDINVQNRYDATNVQKPTIVYVMHWYERIHSKRNRKHSWTKNSKYRAFLCLGEERHSANGTSLDDAVRNLMASHGTRFRLVE